MDDVRFHDLATAGFTQVLGAAVPDAPPPPPDGATDASWVDPGGPYSVATGLHAANVDGGAVTRTLVFANNVGVVTFSATATTGRSGCRWRSTSCARTRSARTRSLTTTSCTRRRSRRRRSPHPTTWAPEMPPTPTATGANTDVLTNLSTWLGAILNDIIRVFADAEGANIALAEQGWTAARRSSPRSSSARLDQEAQSGNDPSMRAAESFAEVLVALGALGDALIAASGPEASGISALELLAEQLDLAMTLRMREDHPALWAVLRLLNLVSDDGAQLANLGDLVGDTTGT